MVVQQIFKYRIYLSNKQKFKLINNLKICKSAYNSLVAISKDAYKFGDVSLSKFDYDAIIKGYSSKVHSQVLQNVSDRVNKAFKNFFRRVKDPKVPKGEKGFPRFKGQVNSVTFPQSGFRLLSNKRLYASKIGNIPIVLHRVPKGKIKTMTIKVNRANQWFACFCCEMETKTIKHPSKVKIGIDVGLESFATLSDGETITNPRFLINSEKKLKVLHRRLSRTKKGSKNRVKARLRLSRQYVKVANQRMDFLHKESRSLVSKYRVIAVEELNIKGMVKNKYLAKHIHDASWSIFIDFLQYKAVTSGGEIVEVDAKGTSKTCSECGAIVDMPLHKRKFKCSCGFVCHRDLNASLNIHGRAGLARTSTPAGHRVRPSSKAVVDESGTICDKV